MVLTRLHEDRQSGDYDFVAGVSESEARQDVMDAHRIVDAIQSAVLLYSSSLHGTPHAMNAIDATNAINAARNQRGGLDPYPYESR